MKKTGPIMIIEDDSDDQELLQETFSILEYPNPVIFFSNGNEALEYLLDTDTPPILIISDINMPKISGIEVREKINANRKLQRLHIPYVFLTTAQKSAVAGRCRLTDYDFFTKPNTMLEIQNTIKTIVEYWLGRDTPSVSRQIDCRTHSPLIQKVA
jgi:CheY-like chemotaxis protein